LEVRLRAVCKDTMHHHSHAQGAKHRSGFYPVHVSVCERHQRLIHGVLAHKNMFLV